MTSLSVAPQGAALPNSRPILADRSEVSRRVLARRLAYIMLVRVILYTLVLGGTVAMHLFWGTPDVLATTYVHVLFVFIASIYLLNIVYGVLQRFLRNLVWMAGLQMLLDLLASSVLIHFTGSADSAFVLFFLLSPIAAAITLSRRAALLTALAGTLLFATTCILGYHHLLPVLEGQKQLPWDVSPTDIGRAILLYGGAMFAVALLAGYLAAQLRSATERVVLQQAYLDDLASLNEDIVRCLTSGLITVDDDGRVLSLNQAAIEILSAPSTWQGEPLSQLAPELAVAALETQEQQRPEIALNVAGETKIIGLSVSPLTDRKNRRVGTIINFQDLTTLREMEQLMRRSEHLATLGRVAAGIAHEIRNPLASISGSIELLCTETSLAPESRRLMDIAQREIERLAGLITELLDYARPKTPVLAPVDLGRVIEPLVANISGLLEPGDAPKLAVVAKTTELWIHADLDQLSGVLWNLVLNAWQAGEKSRIDIAVGREEPDRIFLEVSDQGPGISASDLPHIFQPFFTTKAKGTGLGLATVARIMQDHGGTIEVSSQPGKKTTFTILLPYATANENDRGAC